MNINYQPIPESTINPCDRLDPNSDLFVNLSSDDSEVSEADRDFIISTLFNNWMDIHEELWNDPDRENMSWMGESDENPKKYFFDSDTNPYDSENPYSDNGCYEYLIRVEGRGSLDVRFFHENGGKDIVMIITNIKGVKDEDVKKSDLFYHLNKYKYNENTNSPIFRFENTQENAHKLAILSLPEGTMIPYLKSEFE